MVLRLPVMPELGSMGLPVAVGQHAVRLGEVAPTAGSIDGKHNDDTDDECGRHKREL